MAASIMIVIAGAVVIGVACDAQERAAGASLMAFGLVLGGAALGGWQF